MKTGNLVKTHLHVLNQSSGKDALRLCVLHGLWWRNGFLRTGDVTGESGPLIGLAGCTGSFTGSSRLRLLSCN